MKPILFNTEMVRAILDDKKTVTRRVVKPPYFVEECSVQAYPTTWRSAPAYSAVARAVGTMPYPEMPYSTGDILYVRETWAEHPGQFGKYYYRANSICDGKSTEWGCPAPYDSTENCDLCEWVDGWIKWRPSIHMPKEAARLFLRVTGVRAERLQDIIVDPPGPENQIVREGFAYGCDFIATWQNTIKKSDLPLYGWYANPWVWVIEFERCGKILK